MNPAFVTGVPSALATSSFTGASVQACPRTTARPSRTVSMAASDDSSSPSAPLSRRQALRLGAAMLAAAPLAALAKSGDSPKISIFGVGGASSPYTAGIEKGGATQYSKFAEPEVARIKRIVAEAKERIIDADESLKAKSWDDLRSRLRLEAYEVRKVLRQFEGSLDGDVKKNATKASAEFKVALEDFDQACVQKNPAKASKAYKATVKSLSAWETAVGF